MVWNEDDLQVPIDRPPQLVKLEQLGMSRLNAMTDTEVEERVVEAALATAEKYHKECQGNYDDCVAVVSTLLDNTGSAINGKTGHYMLAKSKTLAEQVCRLTYPDEATEY